MLKEGLAANPNNFDLLIDYGFDLGKYGYAQQHAEIMQQAVDADPNTANGYLNLAFSQMVLGHYELADSLFQRCAEKFDVRSPMHQLGRVYAAAALGDYAAAAGLLEGPETPLKAMFGPTIEALQGRIPASEAADAVIAFVNGPKADRAHSRYIAIDALMTLRRETDYDDAGLLDAAATILAGATESGYYPWTHSFFADWNGPLRETEAFAAAMDAIGHVEVWRNHGVPDDCATPAGEQQPYCRMLEDT